MSPTRVVFLCPTSWGLRNVATSGLLDRVRAMGVRPVVLSSAAADNALSEVWSDDADDDGAPLLAPVRHAGWSRALRLSGHLLRASHARRHRLGTHAILERWHGRASRWPARLRTRLLGAGARVASRDPLYDWQLRASERLARVAEDASAIAAQLRALRPALVVASTCVVRDEQPYLRVARTLGIPTLGCVLSFDNATSKGPLPRCDHYAVWSDHMRDEVLALVPGAVAARVHVTGTPQFDFHARPDFQWPRERVLRALGLEPDARYVLWAANAATYTPAEPALVAATADALASSEVLGGHRIVVRLHPADAPARWTAASACGRRVVAAPGPHEHPVSSAIGQALLVGSLRHADACVSLASTTSLDAAVVDAPVVCAAIGDGRGGALDAGARALHETAHFAPVVRSGGVRLARSVPELVHELSAYVGDRARDREARARLVATLCGAVDGRSADRVARLVAELAHGGVPAPCGKIEDHSHVH